MTESLALDARLARAAFPNLYGAILTMSNVDRAAEIRDMAREARALGWRIVKGEPEAPGGWRPIGDPV